MVSTQKRKRRRRLTQRGGLFGHITGLHFSDRGVRHILMGNKRVRRLFTEKKREECKDHFLTYPKITYKNSLKQKAFDAYRKDSFPTNDNTLLLCGNKGRMLKYSSFRPNGSQFTSEAFEKGMKVYYKEVKDKNG